MGKYDPNNDLPHPGRVIVHSKTYGDHTRAPRGSKKKAELNDILQFHTTLIGGANTPARLVKTEIDYYRGSFPSGQLWQFLVGMFKTQLKLKLPLNVDQLLHKDISKEYPLTRLLKQGFKKAISTDESTIKLEFEKLNPQFRRQSLDGYQVEVAVMYFDFVLMESRSSSAASPIVPLDYPDLLSFEFDKGAPGDRYLILFKITGSYKGELQRDHSTMAMQIIQTGIVG